MQRNSKVTMLQRIGAGLLFCLTAMAAQAGIPLWTIVPALGSNPTQIIPANGTGSVQYVVQNQSQKPKQLVITPIPGIAQTAPCHLSPKGQAGSSCNLTLAITGSALPPGGIHGGPVLCQANADGSPNSDQCYRPSQANSLNITLITAPNVATITVTGSPLLLFPAYPNLSGITRTITVTNQSTDVTAMNVTATLPADWADVTQDASNCTTIAPGASCVLAFTPGTSVHEATLVPVAGSNTNTLNPSLAVRYPWVTNERVYAILPDLANNVIYLGGDFSYVGPNTGYGVPIDSGSAQPLAAFPRVNGSVYAVISDGNDGWYIGGTFTQVGGITRNRIAHILSDYSVDTTFDPNANNSVYALALSGSTVYAGGLFTTIGGQARRGIAALNASDGLATSWNPNANSFVYALALSGSTVYAGGDFTAIGNQITQGFAVLAQ
ncbi:delta-60 repeat domain-containing protein [Legionella dresdenensis]|uniref:Delta-60 repeat domain-containing protein n=1 Tax=Legionella dresdenensis TaxID=450200 RepID=A0ABV8CCF4_9GAMM